MQLEAMISHNKSCVLADRGDPALPTHAGLSDRAVSHRVPGTPHLSHAAKRGVPRTSLS